VNYNIELTGHPSEEVELRFSGNVTIDPKASTLSIKNFYKFYLNRPDKHLLESTEKRIKLAKGTFICLDLFIFDTVVRANAEAFSCLDYSR